LFQDVDNAIGDFDFKLKNDGELIRLFDNEYELIDSVRFNDVEPWPLEADGDGPTLELMNPHFDNALSSSWAASDNHGTPGSENSTYITQDCAGIWGGTAEEDACGVCDDNPSNDNTPNTGTCDCNAESNGGAYVDGCGVCVGGSTELEACPIDCAGVDGGNAAYNDCGTCICNNSEAQDGYECVESEECTQDCSGTWGGPALEDACGVCDDDASNDNTPSTGTCDCYATPGGIAELDECGECAGGSTGVSPCVLSHEKGILPFDFQIKSIYPNPFNPVTTIGYTMPTLTKVKLEVYNVKGNIIDIIEDSYISPGYHQVNWDASDHASGIYFVCMVADGYIQRKKLMLIK